MAADLERIFLFICWFSITGVICNNESPVFEHDMNNLVVMENTPVGQIIDKLEGYVSEGSRVYYGIEGTDYLTVDRNSGDVKIAKLFDRETNDTLQFVVTLTESADINNVVKVPVSIIIDDENDNAPYFKWIPYTGSVAENASIGTPTNVAIRAEDVDLIGDHLEVTCGVLEEFPESCDKFAVSTLNNSETYYEGVLLVNGQLDYNDRQLYQFLLIVTDGKYNTSTKVEIKVLDIQNQPPVFYGSLTAVVREDAAVGSLVLTVHAKDGDRGSPRNITYDLLTNPHDYFLLDGSTGELHVAKPLDREALIDTNGVISLTVRATEVSDSEVLEDDELSSTSAIISLTIKDVNDEAPIFNKPEYRVSVPENIPIGSPLPNLNMTVSDADVGNNSAFSLRLGDDLGKFSVEPSSAVGSASVIIRLANETLDYENPNQRKFIILVIAEETAKPSRFSSSAIVTVDVTDVNDNSPEFESSLYTATVDEKALPGSVVTTITATDRDSGNYGTEGIVYDLVGDGSERYNVNRNTGVITVALCPTPGVSPCIDFEAKTVYFLTYKATDEDGKGRSTSVPLKVSVLDSNDNPPEFTAKNYTVLVDEGATSFELPFFVQARDLDTVSSITYSIADENVTDLVNIDSSNGEIKIINSHGLERMNSSDSIAFDVMANDGIFTERAHVIIRIMDINDHQPKFLQPQYEAVLPEDTMIGTSVIQLDAYDEDTGANSVLTYKIEKGSYGDFTANSTSGVVYVTTALNYDRRKYYNMTVVAIDAGTPALTGTATLNVIVTNVNDKDPYFIPSIQRTEVPKDAKVGTVFYKMKATDPDMNDTDALNFMLVDPVTAIDVNGREVVNNDDIYKDFFAINITSGEIYVANPLKPDVASIIHLSVVVTDTSASNPQHGEGTLIITILEVNDIPPVFASPWEKGRPYYITQILEEQPIGTVLGTFVATDNDSIDHYEIEPMSEYFTVNETTGTVRTRKRIDFEQIQTINFTLVAYDSGVPQLSADAYVVVTVINVNDMAPVFQQNIYATSVKENSPRGTLITKVTATDKDLGDYGIVKYSLSGDHKNDFTINENTGEIKVLNPSILDREKTSEITVKVVASDFASQEEIKNSSVLVRIKLDDANDNAPVFTQHPYAATIVETIPYSPPSPILQLHAQDEDENTDLQYRLIGGNEAGLFFLDLKSGILYPRSSLLGSQRQHTLTAEVSDGVFNDTAKIELTVLDVNQNKPHFKQPSSSNATVTIPEDVEVNHLAMKVFAEDNDAGDNGRVTYHFKIDNNDVQNTNEFSINETSGEIRTRVSLDREKQAQYQLILVARDHGTQTTYETLQYLTISLIDVNDNKPAFITDFADNQYVFHVKENGDVNKKIAKLMAKDDDEGQYGKLYFHVLKGNEDAAFIVDRQSGYVYVNGTLDREAKSDYEFYVKVTNDQNYNSAANEIISEDDASIVKVVVHVEDENDNVPIFKQSSYYAGMNTVAGIGELLTVVSATDEDQGENGALQYEIGASYLYKAGHNHTSGSIVPSPFTVNSEGKITTATFVAEYNQDRFELLIIAREISPPHRESTASVYVWIYELQQLVRVILSRPPREVSSVVDEIVTELSNATGSVIVVDDIKYHVDDIGQIQQDWCDMYMHLVDNDTHSIITIPDVLKVIDDKYDYLKDYYAGFAIENVLPAYIDSMEEQFEPALAALVALLIVLCVGGISVIVICFCFRHWVIADPSDMKCDMLIKKPIIDDLSTTENPLWIEQKLKLYEEQELTMQVFCEPEASRLPCGAALERRGSDGTSVIDNTYATIQHPTRRNSTNNMLSLGPGDYATLGGSVLPLDKASSHSQQMLEAALGFQGCTFQVPDTPPDTVELLRARSELRVNKDGQPEFVSELM